MDGPFRLFVDTSGDVPLQLRTTSHSIAVHVAYQLHCAMVETRYQALRLAQWRLRRVYEVLDTCGHNTI